MAKELVIDTEKEQKVMDELFALGLTRENANDWYCSIMNKEEYEKYQSAYSKLTDSLIVNSENQLLAGVQKNLEKYGLTPLNKVQKENEAIGTMFIFYLPVQN